MGVGEQKENLQLPLTEEQLQTLLGRAYSLTDEEKKIIRKCTKTLGIEHNFKSKCNDCYKDALTLCLLKLKKQNHGCKYYFNLSRGIRIGGHLLNNDNITDEVAEQLLKENPALRFVLKLKTDANS